MRVVIEETAVEASQFVANEISAQIRRKPDTVLGLATGSTPLLAYRELIRMHREEGLDFSKVVTFNLDEYIGLSDLHPQSYRFFMDENLFRHVNIERCNTFVPNGMASDFGQCCADYEREIAVRGGIDLQILGIGTDGHIAFNEPGSSLGSRTRVKCLASETIADNARFFESSKDVPQMALTMGVGTILESRRCLLIGTGAHKAPAIKATIEGHVNSQITASALQLHPSTTIVVDKPAASMLERTEYYVRSEMAQRRLDASSRPQVRAPALLADYQLKTPKIIQSGNKI